LKDQVLRRMASNQYGMPTPRIGLADQYSSLSEN
jgi:hypothetical protein